ncbi:hypothetical protein LNO89_17975 [Klebsiella pneumoniae subsp. pneumoniae]|nr:hypothetical protein [Klebsiella pneumoniae subsp. pneumoniae]
MHSFCHALPGRWHLMSVMLSAASCLGTGRQINRSRQRAGADRGGADAADESAGPVWFLPYLSGERTPHSNPQAKGVFFGLTRISMGRQSWRGRCTGRVGYALADGMDVVHACGIEAAEHHAYRQQGAQRLLAANAGGYQRPCSSIHRTGGDVGPALGAARLAAAGSSTARQTAPGC